jgi:hypothetical protein
MAPEDRDRAFEQALARHLRPAASSSDCLDPEILASYHERLLAPEQMASCKRHIASCDRCQEILAQLEATDDLLIEDQHVPETENVLTMPAPQAEPELAHTAPASSAAAPATVPSRFTRVAQSPWRSKTLRGANWRWLAPAGLIAAGLLVWIAVHEREPNDFQLAKNTQIVPAPAQSSPASPAPMSRSAEAPNAAASGNERAEERAKTEANSPTLRSETRSDKSSPALKTPAPTSESKPQERQSQVQPGTFEAKKSAPQQAGDSASAAEPAASGQKERDVPQTEFTAAATSADTASADSAAASSGKPLRKQDSATSPAPPAQHKDEANAVVMGSRSQNNKSLSDNVVGGREAEKKAKAEVGAAVARVQSSARSKPGVIPAVQLASSGGQNVVTAPNSMTMWRFAAAGLVEQSSDAGVTWNVQPTGVVVDLLSGSAPSAKVCWIVGRNATILRTTDGGAHWTQVSAPATSDITTVFAVNAKQATVTTLDRTAFTTKDAGQSWTREPKP